jgi:hypothetical protein
LELEYPDRIIQLKLEILWGVVQLELETRCHVIQLDLEFPCSDIQLELDARCRVVQMELDVHLVNRSIKAYSFNHCFLRVKHPSIAILVVSLHVIFSPTC